MTTRIVFVGGGNMAAALIGGLVKGATPAAEISAIEPDAGRRAWLEQSFAIATAGAPDARVREHDVLVLAVKPQQAREACTQLAPFVGRQLVLSVAAGIRARDLARWLGTRTIVRAMPNTPALIGEGVTGLVALDAVTPPQRELAAAILRAAGQVVWIDEERHLDAVTAISGSGPAYVFYFIEAMIAAARELGLTDAQARQLAVGTFTGAARLAAQSDEPLAVLRERVTSKGGTTAAALASMEADRVGAAIVRAVHAADRRAGELGDEFGRD